MRGTLLEEGRSTLGAGCTPTWPAEASTWRRRWAAECRKSGLTAGRLAPICAFPEARKGVFNNWFNAWKEWIFISSKNFRWYCILYKISEWFKLKIALFYFWESIISLVLRGQSLQTAVFTRDSRSGVRSAQARRLWIQKEVDQQLILLQDLRVKEQTLMLFVRSSTIAERSIRSKMGQ